MYRKHRAVALLTVIWITAVLLILVVGFAAVTHSETLIARNYGDQARARWAAKAGIRQAEVTIADIVAQPYTDLGGSSLVLTSAEEEYALDEMAYQVVIDDEAGKLNLNTAEPESLAAFFPAEVVDAIIDWRDEDSTPEAQGAEEDYYAGTATPYHCKNAPFSTVGELLLVRGVSRDMLSEPVTDDGHTLEDLLTTVSYDDNTDAQGQARLNIRSASQEQWESRCGDVLTAEEIEAILTHGASSSFNSPAGLLAVPNLSREKVAQVYDRLTAVDETTRPGLINLNTAPVEVLATLPGMNETHAQAIVQHRETQGAFADVGGLLAVSAISNSVFTDIADHVTTRSRILHVAATGQSGDGMTSTVTCILQAETGSGDTAMRVLYWRE